MVNVPGIPTIHFILDAVFYVDICENYATLDTAKGKNRGIISSKYFLLHSPVDNFQDQISENNDVFYI